MLIRSVKRMSSSEQGFSRVTVFLFSARLRRAHFGVCKVFARLQARKNLTHSEEEGSLARQAR